MNTGHPARARRRADEARRRYEAMGDTAGVAGVLDGRAMATFLDGRLTAAVDAFDRAAGLFTDAGDLVPRAGVRRPPRDGLVDTTAALDLAEQFGHHEGRSYALWHRAEALASLDAAVHLPLFASWGASRLALVRLARGDAAGAGPLVRRARREGPPLSRFEADLAAAEHARARGDPGVTQLARQALHRADAAGYLAHRAQLQELAGDA